ncbi:MAG: DsbA family protein [Longimicrobiales bacterium]
MAQSQRKHPKAGGKGLQPFYIVLGLVVIGGLAALVWAATAREGSAATEPIPVDSTLLANPPALYAAATPMTRGPDDAPVKLVVFIDYMCPACGAFASRIEPVLQERYVDSGIMQIVSYDFPLGGAHVHSFLAARAARCAAEQGAFWTYHDRLFGSAGQWGSSPTPPIDQLAELGTQAGLDGGALEQCIRSDRYADVVSANRLLGEQLGVNATPTVIINNRRLPTSVVFDVEAIGEIVAQAAPAAAERRQQPEGAGAER